MSVSKISSRCAAAIFLAALPWGLARAQVFDFSGQWELATDVTLPGENEPCSFVGYAQVVHDLEKGTLSGNAVLELVSGPSPCPPEMAAELSGNPDGVTIFNGMLFGGIFGEATFTGGIVNPPGRKGMLFLGGGFDVIVGPYDGLSGGWAGTVSDGVFRDSFETLVVTAGSSLLALLGAGILIGRRRA